MDAATVGRSRAPVPSSAGRRGDASLGRRPGGVRRAVGFALAIVLAAMVAPEPATRELAAREDVFTPDERAFFAWLDGLGGPSFAASPFVRVQLLPSGQRTSDRHEPFTFHGFLAAERPEGITILDTRLGLSTYLRKPARDATWRVGTVTQVDLTAFVMEGIVTRQRVSRAQRGTLGQADPFGAYVWWGYDWTWRMAVLARACVAQGREDVGRRLLDFARTDGLAADLEGVRRGIADEAWVEVELALVRPESTDADRVAVVEQWLRRFGDVGSGRERAEEHLRVLQTMAQPGSRRASIPDDELARRPPEEQARIWVERLEQVADARGSRRPSAPGAATPADEALAALGFAAVPTLLDALDDARLTRRLTFGFRDRGWQRPTHEVARVGDVALEVLRRISANAIRWKEGDVPSADRSMSWSPRVGSPSRRIVVEAARAWFAAVRPAGYAVWLERRVDQGPGPIAAARRLVEVDPDAAVRAIVRRWRRLERAPAPSAPTDPVPPAEVSDEHQLLLELLTEIPGAAATSALAGELEAAREPAAAIPFALSLVARGDPRGLAFLLRVWPRVTAAADDDELADRTDEIVHAFAGSDAPEAIRAVAQFAREGDIERRLSVVLCFAAAESTEWGWSTGSAYQAERPGGTGTRSPEVREEVERLLADLLQDDARPSGSSLRVDGEVVDPVVGELAAWALARHFPDRWKFDPSAGPKDRRLARLAAANTWRARRGLAPLPMPAPRVRSPSVDADVAASVAAALAAGDAARRDEALARIEAHGLPGLPALRDALHGLGSAVVGREELARLATRISMRVTDVTLRGEMVASTDPFRIALEALRGRVLDGGLVVDVVRAFTKHRPATVFGMDLRVVRGPDGDGARLVVVVSQAKVSAGLNSHCWTHAGPWVRRGARMTGGGGGVTARDYGGTAGAWDQWQTVIDDALAGVGPDDDLELGGTIGFVP